MNVGLLYGPTPPTPVTPVIGVTLELTNDEWYDLRVTMKFGVGHQPSNYCTHNIYVLQQKLNQYPVSPRALNS